MRKGSDTAGKTETLLSRNARLVAFLCVIVAFLAVAILLGQAVHGDVDSFLSLFEKEDEREVMPLEALYAICDRPSDVTGATLARYRGENEERRIDGVVVEKYYFLNGIGDRYNLSATERTSDGKIVYLVLYDSVTKKQIDLLDKTSDIDGFLSN